MQSADSNKPPLRFRNLRIGWSIIWGLACVLLIVLWVRSYWRFDQIVWNNARTFAASSHRGKLSIQTYNGSMFLPPGWFRVSFSNSAFDSDDFEPTTLLGFAWQTRDGWSTVVLPIWFVLLLAGGVGVTAWLPKFTRFS